MSLLTELTHHKNGLAINISLLTERGMMLRRIQVKSLKLVPQLCLDFSSNALTNHVTDSLATKSRDSTTHPLAWVRTRSIWAA
jgi:hypothetical protein